VLLLRTQTRMQTSERSKKMASHRFQTTTERSLTEDSLDAPLLTFDLPTLLAQLKHEDLWQTEKRNALTLLKGQGLRVVLVAMHADTAIPPHQVESPVTVQVVEGRLQCDTTAESVTLRPGQVLALQPGIRHAVKALEESTFLLTLATNQSHPAERERQDEQRQ
jgi:quercetin dioxygenase-like cupin family protein